MKMVENEILTRISTQRQPWCSNARSADTQRASGAHNVAKQTKK